MILYLQMIQTDEDKAKFERLYTTYRGQMYHVAYQILKNSHDAEDAVHQAFLSLIKNADKISSVMCPKTRSYVVITVERKALDIIRTNSKYAAEYVEEWNGLDVPMPGDSGLADAMAQLPSNYREALLLRFDCGFSTKEMAEILGMKQGSVQKLIWRAKEALAKHLEGGEDSHGQDHNYR